MSWFLARQRINRKELSAQLTTTLQGVVDLDRFPKAVVDVAVLVLQVRCYEEPTAEPYPPVAGASHMTKLLFIYLTAVVDVAVLVLQVRSNVVDFVNDTQISRQLGQGRESVSDVPLHALALVIFGDRAVVRLCCASELKHWHQSDLQCMPADSCYAAGVVLMQQRCHCTQHHWHRCICCCVLPLECCSRRLMAGS
jgi:hypothetical protein